MTPDLTGVSPLLGYLQVASSVAEIRADLQRFAEVPDRLVQPVLRAQREPGVPTLVDILRHTFRSQLAMQRAKSSRARARRASESPEDGAVLAPESCGPRRDEPALENRTTMQAIGHSLETPKG